MKTFKPQLLALVLVGSLTLGCKKFLEEKSDQKLLVPVTVAQLQATLDDFSTLNQKDPHVGVTTADEYVMSTANWQSINSYTRNLSVWSAKDAFEPGAGSPWATLYNYIYKANVVLDQIDDIPDKNQQPHEWQSTKGQAYFLRARAYFHLLNYWTMSYDEATADSDLGVPIRKDINYNIPSVRASLAASYQQMIADFKQAAVLLPVTPKHVLRSSKPAAYGFLARVYLSMNKPDSCLKYSQLALAMKGNLMDYNGMDGINPKAEYPFLRFNAEVIFDCYMPPPPTVQKGEISPEIYNAYHDNDLRKTMYHRSAGLINYFKGSYTGNANLFSGLATDELYLMEAECLARLGSKDDALKSLNKLTATRYKTDSYVPYTATTAAEALAIILMERRKGLVFRGLRWMDIRRLNKIGANIVMKRVYDGVTYELNPNELRYALIIPEDIIQISGIQQNLR